jgi:GT2 family glycosyltransferase
MALLVILVDLIAWTGALGLALIAANHLRLVALHGPVARDLLRDPPALFPIDPAGVVPRIAVQIPLFNEPRSVEGAIRAAAALDWPRDRLTIQILDDSTDETPVIVAGVAADLIAEGFAVQHLRRTDRAGFKAGALAAGMAATDAAFFAILDADHRAPPDWLRRAMTVLARDDTIGFAQFRFEFGNRDRNALTRVQQLLADSHFVVEQVGRMTGGEPFQFNGTAALWRRSAIEAAGGWSADTLAEDLDLVLRVYEAGGRGALALTPPVTCEAPATLAAWRTQQQRWSQGFSQAAVKLLPRLWRSDWPLGRKLGASLLLGLQAALPCALAAIVGLLLDMILRGGPTTGHAMLLAAAATLGLMVLVAITWPAYRLLGRGSVATYIGTLMAMPPLLGVLALSATPAILAGLAGARPTFTRTPKTGDAPADPVRRED